MRHRFNIARIDEDDEVPNQSDFEDEYDDYERELGEEDYYEATHICSWCNGLSNNCVHCYGTGTIKRKH